jgi:two-component system, chemotaxis family, CheB/CheR fusion protein
MILSSLNMGVIVVRSDFGVIDWNRTCEELWGLREEEVVGQNLFALDSGMPFPSLRPQILSVITGEETVHRVEVEGYNRRGRRLRCRIRIHPLLEPSDGPRGAMILIESAVEIPADETAE